MWNDVARSSSHSSWSPAPTPAGTTFVGPETAEWVHAATIAVVGEVPIDRLWHAVPTFPTRSEVWLYLMEEYGL